MRYYKKIVGSHVYLSPMNVEDAEQYAVWLNDLAVTDGLGSSSRNASLEGEKKWLTDNAGEYQFAIVRLEDDKLIGNCGLHGLNQLAQSTEVGIFIGNEETRGKGYGTEALSLLVKYCFDYLNLHNVMLKVFSFNERAIHCYKKVGFKEIGRRREAYYVRGRFFDEVFMDILKGENEF